MNEMREPGHPWSCKQIPNGMNPIVICERSDLLARVDALVLENTHLRLDAATAQDAWRALMDERDALEADLDDSQYASDTEIIADLTTGVMELAWRLDAIDALHQPEDRPFGGVVLCGECQDEWPCPTSQIVRPPT